MSLVRSAIRYVGSGAFSQPIRTNTGKAIPAKIDYTLRKLMIDEDDPRYRTRRVDTTIETKHIMEKPSDFTKDDRVMVPTKDDLTRVNGVPEEHQSGRRVRIFIPAKPATQSGTHGIHKWRIEFDNRERWENPLMGWSSTGDPLSNMNVEFKTSQEAADFCDRQGWPCYIDEPNLPKLHLKSYGDNFSWNKRTRRSCK
ncbi:unnamed protein product [Calicophoron daubneyi]|uniref:NADH dehydrogenase [ubiquinone] iron-sulfur protein 4, mitochondrial n=1 Tax=Calicophoron daubneyi TaxID=300641 RepID=A0AAV2U080_CALDB